MNIYVRELKANFKSLIIWVIVMILFIFMGMQEYNSYIGSTGNASQFMELVNKMPSFIKAIWGVGVIDITTAIGYFGAIIPYLVLMAGIQAGTLGCSIIAKEERDKTVEFLMTKPVTRMKIITSKLLAAFTNVIIINLVTFISSVFILKDYTDEPISRIIILSMLSMFFIQSLFLIIGFCLAASMKSPKGSNIITMSIILGSFFLSIIVDLSDKFKFLTFLSPFKYFDTKSYFNGGTLNQGFLVLVLIIILITLITGYSNYKKRDLNM
jgi:ABC-2 type transport system permease protein